MKKTLILGGTQFIGRNLVERLQATDEYDITLFNRQKTQDNLFPDIKKITGDRETDDIKQIANDNWNYVIDISCYYPDPLKNVLECLKGELEKYILVSTCSVYDNDNNHSQLRTEQAETLQCNNSQRTNRTLETYGNRKAECERILLGSGLDYAILRPSLVYGAFDHTDRLYYWLYQVKYNDEILIPDNGERTFSVTYVNDLVDTIINSLTATPSNIHNVVTVPQTSIRQIVDCAKELLSKDVKAVNATPDFLKENGISQWTDMPLWIDGDHFTYSNQQLKDDFKVQLSEFQDTVKETMAFYDSLDWHEPNYGMTEQMRQELIEKIKKEKLQPTINKRN